MMSTESDTGMSVWCNNCDAFPESYNVRVYGDNTVILKCRDCSETMVIE